MVYSRLGTRELFRQDETLFVATYGLVSRSGRRHAYRPRFSIKH